MRIWDLPEGERDQSREEAPPPRPEWNTGGGDSDVPYHFGRHPTSYLHVRDFGRLLLLRSRLDDRHLLRSRDGS